MQTAGPDFLCIGMQKAGTGWLYDALNKLDDFKMSPIKEFHHFDTVLCPETTGNIYLGARLRRQMRRRFLAGDIMGNIRYWQRLEAYIAAGYSHDRNLQLFGGGNRLTGDITPAYSILTREQVREIHNILPDARIILVIRHPVDRAWSSFNMHLRRAQRQFFGLRQVGQKSLEDGATLEALQAFLAEQLARRKSFASQTFASWSAFYDRMTVIGFQNIVEKPAKTIEFIAEQVAGTGIKVVEDFFVADRKSGRKKAKMSRDIQDYLYNIFDDEIQSCKSKFPEIAGGWKAR